MIIRITRAARVTREMVPIISLGMVIRKVIRTTH
jgi:hypothetical protein